jgi:hypothetical protein
MKKGFSIILSLLLFLITLFPFILGIIMFFNIPEYLARLLLPGDGQPLGWFVALIMLLCFGLLLYWSWILPNGGATRRPWKNIVLIVCFVLIEVFLIILELIAPAALILLTSPLGGKYFGG